MNRQIPRGSENCVCPLHKVTMDQVCHKCPWWQHVRGMNPNTGEEIDRWDCAVAFLPILLIEAAKEARGAAAATESLLPDNDEPGRLYGDSVDASLRGVAADVTRLELPASVKDVSEWLENGGKVEDLLQVAGLPGRIEPGKAPLGTIEAAILAAIDRSEHKSLTTDTLPMLIAGLPGEEAWNARAKEPIVRYRNVPRTELAKARASISRALGSLARRGLVQKTGRRIRRAQPAPPPTIRAKGSPVVDQHHAPRPTA